MIRALRTAIGVAAMVVTLVPLATLAGLAGRRPSADRFVRAWFRIVLACAGVRLIVRRHAELDPAKSYVFVSNHTSHMDVPAIVTASPTPLRFVAKRELRKIPIFGWAAARVGHVFVDRKDSHRATRAIQRRVQSGLGGVALLFFAEGTRSTTEEMLPFKKGAAIVALQTGLDCVPIAVAGARDVLPPKGFAAFKPGPIAVVFGEPIPVARYSLERRD